MTQIPEKLYYKIGEVAGITKVKPHVLRYWETEFRIINPRKSQTKQRVYSKKDIHLILEIKRLLYKEKFTLEGAKKRMKEIQNEVAKQMKFTFDQEKYANTLHNLKKELSAISKMLSK